MAEREYYRLTRSRRRPGIAAVTVAQYSLWRGRDHLLCVESNGYMETYKRFYYRDIQAITTRRTSRRMVTSIVLAGMAALSCLIGLAISATWSFITFGLIALVGCLVPLLINFLLGPTCACQLRTAVQTEDLPIGRIRKARKVRDIIRPMIAEAQGQITPEEVHAQMQAIAASPLPASGARYAVDDVNLPPRIL